MEDMKRNIVLLILGAILLLLSCSQQQRLARRFVKNNQKTVVALYLPDRLIKKNLRNDSLPTELGTASLQTQIDYMEGQIKVVNKIDDEHFLDILYLTMKETLEDYGLTVKYWEGTGTQPDSVHWVVDIPRIEVTEVNDSQPFCDWLYGNRYCTDVPVDLVNVAAWFDLLNGETDQMAFTEQNYFNDTDVIFDIDYQSGNVIAKSYSDVISIDGFYRFATILGKLYAGYCYDFMLNKYVDNQQVTPVDANYRLRYDPYERYFYQTSKDYLIEIKPHETIQE